MESVAYTVIDVFATTPYKGNPLAIVDNSAGRLTDTQMKLMACQFNLSETTFFSPSTLPNAAYHLRSFLPDGKEVFGAGHNILGVWWFLAQDGRLDFSQPNSVNELTGVEEHIFQQELGSVVSPVKILRHKAIKEGESLQFTVSIRQVPPQAHVEHPDTAALAASVGLEPSEVGLLASNGFHEEATRLPPQVMSTSTTRHLMVPVASVAALDRVSVQRDKLLQQLALVDKTAYGIYLFTTEPSTPGTASDIAYRARFFSPGMTSEDPATGSAAGPLSAYLHRHGLLELVGGSATIKVQQGLNLGRECVIEVHLTAGGVGDKELNTDIIGGGAMVANGQILVPNASTAF